MHEVNGTDIFRLLTNAIVFQRKEAIVYFDRYFL